MQTRHSAPKSTPQKGGKKTPKKASAREEAVWCALYSSLTQEEKNDPLRSAEALLSDIAEKPHVLVGAGPDVVSLVSELTKKLYDYGKAVEPVKSTGLRSLLVDGFDREQVWGMLQLYSEPLMQHVERKVPKIEKKVEKELAAAAAAEDEEEEGEEEEEGDDFSGGLEEEGEDGDEPEGWEDEPWGGDGDGVDDGSDGDDGTEDRAEKQKKKKKKQGGEKRAKKGFIKEFVDSDNEEEFELTEEEKKLEDRFFRFQDMEDFMNDAEAAQQAGDDGEEEASDDGLEDDEDGDNGDGDDEEEEDEEDDDDAAFEKMLQKSEKAAKNKGKKKSLKMEDLLFGGYNFDGSEEEEEEEEEEEDKTKKKGGKYQQFFDPPSEDGDGDDDDDGEDDEEDDEEDEDMDEDTDEEDEEEDEEEDGRGKSRKARFNLFDQTESELHKHKKQMAEQVEELEEGLVAEKTWELKGEVRSRDRPENSLLEAHLDYQHAARPAPVLTEEATHDIEEIIRRRVKDQVWDDVVRQVERKGAFKPRGADLDMEKSKEGLGDVYEKEYMEKVMGVEKTDELQKQHDEIDALFAELGQKLDALSNFHFTPKPADTDVEVRANVASLQMEEKIPLAVSTAQTLAPEEVYQKSKKEVKGDAEKTSEDRARERQAKKTARRKRLRQKESDRKAYMRANPHLSEKVTKEKALTKINQKGGLKGVTVADKHQNADKSSREFTSSARFFGNLKNEQMSGGADAAAMRKRAAQQAEQPQGNSKKLKL